MRKNKNMKHVINDKLQKGCYRIICAKCKTIYEQSTGDFTIAAIASMKYKLTCELCSGELILETNPITPKPKYNKEHPYMGGQY